ncbi:MAG: DUF983 domain-containing protein [Pseudomonadota bacterium]
MPSDTTMDAQTPRPLAPALLRGWRRRCPNCGGGPMMQSYLQVRDTCASCGQELHHHRADDMPAWATILIVGHVLAFLLLTVESTFHPPLWVHWAVWPALVVGMSLWMLPRVKGAVVAMQWAWRMHGFEHAPEVSGTVSSTPLDSRPAPDA